VIDDVGCWLVPPADVEDEWRWECDDSVRELNKLVSAFRMNSKRPAAFIAALEWWRRLLVREPSAMIDPYCQSTCLSVVLSELPNDCYSGETYFLNDFKTKR